ncbi:hypothetical protein BDW72DRAFT_188309 [Aspergillus terricola var. indicus]
MIRSWIRRHVLSHPVPARRKHQPTHPTTINTESTFLTTLPLKIRLQIYQPVLPQGTVHFLTEKNYTFYILCEEPAAQTTHSYPAVRRAVSPLRYWGMALDNISEFGWGNPYLPPDIVSRGEVALLRVCRKVYGEALPVLYGSVSFQVDEMETWMQFAIGGE